MKVSRFVVFIVALPFAALAHSPALAGETLQAVAGRVAKSLAAGDWALFRRDAAPAISIEEHWTAYAQYFVAERRLKATLGEHSSSTVSFKTGFDVSKPLNEEQLSIFKGFCKVVKETKSYWSTSWGPWPTVEAETKIVGLDHSFALGPCAHCKVASNLHWSIEFDRSSGRWRARRLMIVGH